MKAPTDNKIHDACCKYDKEDGSAMFVEWWDIFFRRVFHDSVAILRHDDRVGGVMNYE